MDQVGVRSRATLHGCARRFNSWRNAEDPGEQICAKCRRSTARQNSWIIANGGRTARDSSAHDTAAHFAPTEAGRTARPEQTRRGRNYEGGLLLRWTPLTPLADAISRACDHASFKSSPWPLETT